MLPYFRIFSIAILICSSLGSNAQAIIQEEDVSITVLKWFYDHYPNSETIRWTQEKTDGNQVFTVKFNFEGKEFQTSYNQKGKRISELAYLDTPPISVTNFLYERFDKFKLRNVAKKTLFISKEVSYVVVVKSKMEGVQEIELDENSTTVINQVAVSDN